MKKYFLKKIKDIGFEVCNYETSHEVGAKFWFISIEKEDQIESWSGEYFVGETGGKEYMIKSFEEWIMSLSAQQNLIVQS